MEIPLNELRILRTQFMNAYEIATQEPLVMSKYPGNQCFIKINEMVEPLGFKPMAEGHIIKFFYDDVEREYHLNSIRRIKAFINFYLKQTDAAQSIKRGNSIIDEKIEIIIDQFKYLKYSGKHNDPIEFYKIHEELLKATDDYSKSVFKMEHSFWISKFPEFNDTALLVEILMDCLKVFHNYKDEKVAFKVKMKLLEFHIKLENDNESRIYSEECIQIAEVENDFSSIGICFYSIGNMEMKLFNLEKAIGDFEKAIKYFIKFIINSNEKDYYIIDMTIGASYLNMANISKILGESEKIEPCYLNAIDYLEKSKFKSILGRAYLEFSDYKFYIKPIIKGDWSLLFYKAIDLFDEDKNNNMLIGGLNKLAFFMAFLGEDKKAIKCLIRGMKILIGNNKDEAIQNEVHYINHLNQFVGLMLDARHYNLAESALLDIIKIARAYKQILPMIFCFKELAQIYTIKNNLEKTKFYADQIMECINDKINEKYFNQNMPLKIEYTAESYLLKEDFQNALFNFEALLFKIDKQGDKRHLIQVMRKVATIYMSLSYINLMYAQWLKIHDISTKAYLYEFVIMSKIELSKMAIISEDFQKAEKYLNDSNLIAKKHYLNTGNLDKVFIYLNFMRELAKPANKSFNQIIKKYYDGIVDEKINKKLFLKFWINFNFKDLCKYVYSITGLKVIIFNDDLKKSEAICNLSWLFDYFVFQSFSFEGKMVLDEFEYPFKNFEFGEDILPILNMDECEQLIFENINSFKSKEEFLNYLSKMLLKNKIGESFIQLKNINNNFSYKFCVTSLQLPKLTYDYFQKYKLPVDIINSNSFTLELIDRSLNNNQFYWDILSCYRLNIIPIYLRSNFDFNSLNVLNRIELKLPIKVSKIKNEENIKIIKNLFYSLASLNEESAVPILNKMRMEFDKFDQDDKSLNILELIIVRIDNFVKYVNFPVILMH